MSLRFKERFKTYLISILIITSLIQVGILWEYQNHGLPTSFLNLFFFMSHNSNPIDAAQKARSDYFQPNSVVASEGLNTGSYRILAKNTDDYIKIWDSTKQLMRSILTARNIEGDYSVISNKDNRWLDIIQNIAVIVEFKKPIRRDFMSWLLNVSPEGSVPGGFSKILIAPYDDVNYNIMTVYLLDDKDSIYKYNIRVSGGEMSKDEWKAIIDGAESKGLKVLTSVSYLMGKASSAPYRKDMLISGEGRRDSILAIRSINSLPPATLKEDQTLVSEAILGNEKSSYDTYDTGNGYEFRNLNNFYKLTFDGILEYRYLPAVEESKKLNVGKSFENAVRFIEGIKNQIPGIELALSDAIEDTASQSWEFRFDYMVNGLPTAVQTDNSASGRKLINAVVIKADENRVTYCYWLLRSFEQAKEGKYSTSYADLFESISKKAAETDSAYFVNDINYGYMLAPSVERVRLDPSWIIGITDNNKNNKNIFIGMEPE